MHKGILYGVGVGPGDPEEMTLKAVRVLKEADILILPEAPREKCASYAIAVKAVPEIKNKPYKALTIPMSYDKRKQKEAYDRAADAIVPDLKAGKKAAYITIGDPSIFSSFSELDERIQAMGFMTAIVSGIPSFCACAAVLDIPLVKGKEELRIIPGNAQKDENISVTEIYMKSGHHMGELKKELLRRTTDDESVVQVSAVSNCGYPDQRICHSVDEIPEKAGYMTTIIVKNKPLHSHNGRSNKTD